MKISNTLVVGAGLLSTTSALTLRKRQDGGARVLGVDIARRTIGNPVKRDQARINRRSGTVQASLENEETLYFANVSIGTPAQTLRLHIDTGSSDLWVNSATSSECSDDECSFAGTYSANSSSTYKYVNSDFNITYADGSGAAGDYVKDKVTIGGTSISSQQFGIGYTSSSVEGILGIGYTSNEVSSTTYSNLPASLASNGDIASNAYSLWLNDLDASTGNILFGGVDTEKFEGTLSTLPIEPEETGTYAEFLLTLTSVNLGSTSIASDEAIAVLLDSGTSLTYLPESWTNTIYNSVDARYDSSEGAAFVPCSLSSNTTTLDFTFTSVTISITFAELVLDVTSTSGQSLYFSSGAQACLFGIAPTTSTPILGDTFLRSAYVVYDLSNNEISIAQTKFNVSASNVLEISSGTSGVPSATVVANAATATADSVAGGSITGSSGTLGLTGDSGGSSTFGVSYAVLMAAGVLGVMGLL